MLKCENSKLPSVSYLGSTVSQKKKKKKIYLGSTKTSEKGYHESSSPFPSPIQQWAYLTLKKVIGLTEAHQDKFWAKLLPFLKKLQVGLEILDNLASMLETEEKMDGHPKWACPSVYLKW